MLTRSQTRKRMSKKPSNASIKMYKKRLAKSICRGKRSTICRAKRGCNVATGKKRSFCRKSKNTRKKSHRK